MLCSIDDYPLTDTVEQEYDAHADMIDDQDAEEPPNGPGPYPQGFVGHQAFDPRQHGVASGQGPPNGGSGQAMAGFDPFDPMLDADPFGLTASMHFPTQFSFQESSMRK